MTKKRFLFSVLSSLILIVAFILSIINYNAFNHLKTQNTILTSNLNAVQSSVTELNQTVSLLTNSVNQLNSANTSKIELAGVLAIFHLQNAKTLLTQEKPVAMIQTELNDAAILLTSMGAVASELAPQLQTVTVHVAALPNLDIVGSLAALDQLKTNLASLSFAAPQLPEVPEKPVPTTFWGKLWVKLKMLIVIRTNEEIGVNLVSDQARFDALRSLSLLIDEAKWQMLNGEDPAATLDQLLIQVKSYTAFNKAQQTWVVELNAVKQQPVVYPALEVNQIVQMISALDHQLALIAKR